MELSNRELIIIETLLVSHMADKKEDILCVLVEKIQNMRKLTQVMCEEGEKFTIPLILHRRK